MQKDKKYIEFVGQHTAGKTSTIHRIVDGDMLRPLVAMYPQKIKRSNTHLTLSLPTLFVQSFGDLFFLAKFMFRFTKLSPINYHAVWRHLFKMVLLHRYYQHYDFDIWMKDDMLHLLPRSAFRSGVDVRHAFGKFFAHFAYLYDAIIYIDLPKDVMLQRFSSRFSNRSRRRRKSREPVYERAFEQNKILKRVLFEQSEVPVLEISGTNGVEENAVEVVEFINKIVYER